MLILLFSNLEKIGLAFLILFFGTKKPHALGKWVRKTIVGFELVKLIKV